MKQQVIQLSGRLDEAFQITEQQQLYVESLCNKERLMNIVITALVEVAEEADDTDEEVQRVVQATRHQGNFDPAAWEMKHLGQPSTNKKRQILVVEDGRHCNGILRVSEDLTSLQRHSTSVKRPNVIATTVRSREREIRETRTR